MELSVLTPAQQGVEELLEMIGVNGWLASTGVLVQKTALWLSYGG